MQFEKPYNSVLCVENAHNAHVKKKKEKKLIIKNKNKTNDILYSIIPNFVCLYLHTLCYIRFCFSREWCEIIKCLLVMSVSNI